MKQLFPVLAILLLSGCDDARKADGNAVSAANATEASGTKSEAGTVSGFKSPELAGLVVRNYPGGVQIAAEPSARGTTPPPIGHNDLLWSLSKGAVFTSVNGTPVRDAMHFRELMDAIKQGQEISLGQQLYLVDAGNGMSSIRTSPPEGQ